MTDWENVIQGNEKLAIPKKKNVSKRSDDPKKNFRNTASQFQTAQDYARYVKKRYSIPNGKLDLTGHSLGGSISLAVGAKQHIPAVAFNGPFPTNQLSTRDIDYLKNHPTMYANYLNKDDFIGNFNNIYGPAVVKGDFQHFYKNGSNLEDYFKNKHIPGFII